MKSLEILMLVILCVACQKAPDPVQGTPKQPTTEAKKAHDKAEPKQTTKHELSLQNLIQDTPRARLAHVARDDQHKASTRLVSMRLLEKGEDSVLTHWQIARDPHCQDPAQARLLRNNAVAALVRAEKKGSEQAIKALSELAKDSSLKRLITLLREKH